MNNDRIGLHVRKLEAAAIIFKILLVEISAMEMFTGKLALDCSSSLIAFETKLRYILSFADKKIRFLLTCFFIFVYSVLFQFSALMSETAFSQGFLFALDTCLMLASEYCFSPLLFVYTWEEEQIFF